MVLLTSVAPSQCWVWDETNEAFRCPREGDMHAWVLQTLRSPCMILILSPLSLHRLQA